MIGKRIQTMRLKSGLSLSELAHRSGVSKSYLSAIERDLKQNPSIQFLEKIASVFGVEVEAFIRPATSPEWEVAMEDQEWMEILDEVIHSGISKEKFRTILDLLKETEKRSKINDQPEVVYDLAAGLESQERIDDNPDPVLQELIHLLNTAESADLKLEEIRELIRKARYKNDGR